MPCTFNTLPSELCMNKYFVGSIIIGVFFVWPCALQLLSSVESVELLNADYLREQVCNFLFIHKSAFDYVRCKMFSSCNSSILPQFTFLSNLGNKFVELQKDTVCNYWYRFFDSLIQILLGRWMEKEYHFRFCCSFNFLAFKTEIDTEFWSHHTKTLLNNFEPIRIEITLTQFELSCRAPFLWLHSLI